jgi:hypothetical protein
VIYSKRSYYFLIAVEGDLFHVKFLIQLNMEVFMNVPKLYWILCGVIFFIGAGIAISTMAFPGTGDSGEMPSAFGAGVDIAILAAFGFTVGGMLKVVQAVINHKQNSSKGGEGASADKDGDNPT